MNKYYYQKENAHGAPRIREVRANGDTRYVYEAEYGRVSMWYHTFGNPRSILVGEETVRCQRRAKGLLKLEAWPSEEYTNEKELRRLW